MTPTRVLIDRSGLDALIATLAAQGYRVLGPTLGRDAIVLGDVAGTDDLPVGWTDEQEAGHYRLRRRDDAALFGYVLGPHSFKRFLYPPRQRLWSVSRGSGPDLEVRAEPHDDRPLAFLGVRPCEIAAMRIQERVLTGGEFPDPSYADRYGRAFVVAVQCTEPGGTCFCASMRTGPRAGTDCDLALTELLGPDRHDLLVEVRTPRGEQIVAGLPAREATDADVATANEALARAEASMGRSLDTEGIVELLERNIESPAWGKVADRCLACANCTSVCPTCFCTTVEDTTDLTGQHAERWRRWDSCFNRDFSFIAGSLIRHSTRSRYRQWMTHKLSAWHRQFGTSGCVGCGRCITWCPVGIDITHEVDSIRNHERSASTFHTVGGRYR
ncbi:MAG: 4Fe-4S dicluster domain-containing protein [Planctomycetes bacterium]|nr:4Fe-4S dicluster domain-containing protein [Planctomycetota bacterium]